MTANTVHHTAMLAVASRVGTNFKTLRDNKRALSCGLILAVAVEDFKWRDVWADAKKAAGFAKLEKDEQNQFNVMGTATRLVSDNWDKLSDEERDAIRGLKCTVSMIAKRIKDAEKAAEKAEADALAQAEQGEEARAEQTDERGHTVEVSPNVGALQTVIAMLAGDSFASDETPLLAELFGAVDALRARIVEATQKAA